MNTKLVTTNVRLCQWNDIIQDRIHSGLTVDAYCEGKDISRSMYYYWLRKVKEAAIESYPESFAELIPMEIASAEVTGAAFAPQMILRTKGISIEVNDKTPGELIALVLEVAGDAK